MKKTLPMITFLLFCCAPAIVHAQYRLAGSDGSGSTTVDFATQADAEGGTETTKAMNSLRTYQAVTSYSFLKSNIDISPADGYPDKANGFIGTTLSADDNVTWNMNANKGFNIALSGTGKLTTSFGTNTSTLNASPFVDYIWNGNSSINA